MKNHHIKLISLLLTAILLITLTSCVNNMDENQDGTDSASDTSSNETEKQPSDTTNEQTKENKAILADLNNDGTDDKILITYDDEQKSSATIKVVNGKDDSELMSDTLKLNANKTGAYYLQKGKGNECDRLVFWSYSYLDNGKLAFNYRVFSYEPDGETVYGDRGSKTFDVSFDAAIATGEVVFSTMINKINENIQASRSTYEGYLLLDNQGDDIIISTAENMLTPTDLTFNLEDFVVDTSAE